MTRRLHEVHSEYLVINREACHAQNERGGVKSAFDHERVTSGSPVCRVMAKAVWGFITRLLIIHSIHIFTKVWIYEKLYFRR